MLRPYRVAHLSFDLSKEIGQEGRNSRVYIARDRQLDADLVVKMVPKDKFKDEERFFEEASILYEGQHPYVVPINYACEDDEHIYLAMPYFARGSLSSVMASRFLKVRDIVRFSTNFLSALHNIHSKGLIHFDVKPDNLLLSQREEALLSDFGLAKRIASNGGTSPEKQYIKMVPPEAFRDDEHTSAWDIYQAGLTIYRMCVGNQCFNDQFFEYVNEEGFDGKRFVRAVCAGEFPDRSCFPEHIPNRLKRTVEKCLKVDPGERYDAAIDVVNDIAEISDNHLDWEYAILGDGSRQWHKHIDGRSYCLVVDPDGVSVATKCVGGGEVRRIREFCVGHCGTQLIHKFLRLC